MASSYIPRLSDSLSAADKFELVLYTSIFEYDAFLNYQDLRNGIFSDEENITAKNLYAVKMYKKVGFTVYDENEEDYIMVVNLLGIWNKNIPTPQ